MACGEQALQQRLGAAAQVALRPGAVDDRDDRDRAHAGFPSGGVGDRDTLRIGLEGGGPAGEDGQLARGAEGVDAGRDLGREAVAVDVPPRPEVAEEAFLLSGFSGTPQILREGAKLVDRRAPADRFGAGADGAEERDDGGGRAL